VAIVKKSSLGNLFAIELHNKKVLEKKSRAHFVLVVEEGSEQREQIRSILSEEFTVLLSANVQHAIDLLRVHKVAVIVSSNQVSKADGTGLIELVRADAQLRDFPILVLATPESRLQVLKDGADDCIALPYQVEELAIRVRNLSQAHSYKVKLENELRSARKIQQALLPADRVTFAGGRFEFLYQPCDELSGDFLDLIPIPSGYFIYVADVTSHGAAAAQVTYLVKSLFREAVRADGELLSPAELIYKISVRFLEFGLDYWVGITALKFNVETHEVWVAQTNSPMPLLLTKEKAQMISSDPVPTFGQDIIALELEKVNTRLILGEGESIYIFTDGSFEFDVMGTNRSFGERQLFKLLKKFHGNAWRSRVLDELKHIHGSSNFPDDISIGCLTIDPLS
jgi:serine phosphatase RsbU (regulator of sigma subunit)